MCESEELMTERGLPVEMSKGQGTSCSWRITVLLQNLPVTHRKLHHAVAAVILEKDKWAEAAIFWLWLEIGRHGSARSHGRCWGSESYPCLPCCCPPYDPALLSFLCDGDMRSCSVHFSLGVFQFGV